MNVEPLPPGETGTELHGADAIAALDDALQAITHPLTKRAVRMRGYCQKFGGDYTLPGPSGEHLVGMAPLSNVWLGVSVEDQKHADERIPLLLQTPAAVRFISAEPLLGALDLSNFLIAGDSDNPRRALNTHGQTGTCLEHGSQLSSGKGHAGISPQASGQRDQGAERPAVRKLDWVIHAGKSREWLDPDDVREYPGMAFGAVIAVAQLVGCVNVENLPERFRGHEHALGPFCWLLANIRRLPHPITVNGAQGLWSPAPSLLRDVQAQLEVVGA